jgi:hypothetical protein
LASSSGGEYAKFIANETREALRRGFWGWFDDDVAILGDWGFDLGRIEVPVRIWRGRDDRFVSVSHGEWLAEHIAGRPPTSSTGTAACHSRSRTVARSSTTCAQRPEPPCDRLHQIRLPPGRHLCLIGQEQRAFRRASEPGPVGNSVPPTPTAARQRSELEHRKRTR